MKKLIYTILISWLLLSVVNNANARETYERRLTVTELINEMVNCQDSIYTLENAEIVFDAEEAREIMKPKYFETVDPITKTVIRLEIDTLVDKIVVKAQVIFENCTFTIPDKSSIHFYNLTFDNGLFFSNCRILDFLAFDNCSFNGLMFERSTLKWGVNIYRCKIFEFFLALNCDFLDNYLRLDETQLIDTTATYDYFGHERRPFPYLFISSRNENLSNIIIRKCKFNAKDKLNNIVRISGNYDKVRLDYIEFHTPVDLEDCFIHNSFVVGDLSTFDFPVGVERLSFPERNTHFRWDLLKGHKLCLYDDYSKGPYLAQSDSELIDTYNYTGLISAYKNFFSMYKNRGDMESANGCYVEMKDIETRRLNFLYNQNPTIQSFFKLQLNRFLKTFCDYGTSPVKSLIISLYVVLGFACFYFFFYSDWDRINRTFLMRKYNKLLTYFRSEQKLEDFYTEEHKEEFQSYAQFKDNLQDSKIEVPLFINLLGQPLYHLSLVQHNVKQWMYRRSEILGGKWIDLSKGRRIYVSVITGISVLFYIAYLISIRSINSLFLSINTFSTLGFGDIPVKGISRYMAILEGFLGWFLLSIFSVSLISQILQN